MDGPISSEGVDPAVTLVAFDFDGTLSADEMTVLLGRRVDAEAEMASITERAMHGELPYAESLRRRVALLEGLALEEVQRAFEPVELRPGASELLGALESAGVRTAILTGGFERGVAAALGRAGVGVDRVVANRLVDDGAALTGAVDGPLIEGTKDDALAGLADALGLALSETVAVGDGANDRPMLEVAGLAIGFDPKPAVVDVVDESVDSMAELRELFRRRGVLDR